MALRVLLADESSTIKKVMQLALQDFGVEVKAVPIGLDVLQVAKSFQPDIVFADVLLAKKNGYEVCADLKNDSVLKKIPVVLMWSGFMDIDEAKAKSCGANRRLEKPFDADALRGIVRDLVPTTQTNEISQFLSFPDLPPIVEDQKQSPADEPAAIEFVDLKPPATGSSPTKTETFPIEDYEEDEFQQVPLPKAPQAKQPKQQETWSHQSLNQFKIQLPPEDFGSDLQEIDLDKTTIALSSSDEEVALIDLTTKTAKAVAETVSQTLSQNLSQNLTLPKVSDTQAELMAREEARAVIQEIAWKILPDICERVVREELQKLLKEAERL
ncbi:MAG: response regulator [Proteobacteria bacterium]|jgi:CheY-like chemotaxis protein|nr:response regulator [Pseudomonadota bacterium]